MMVLWGEEFSLKTIANGKIYRSLTKGLLSVSFVDVWYEVQPIRLREKSLNFLLQGVQMF